MAKQRSEYNLTPGSSVSLMEVFFICQAGQTAHMRYGKAVASLITYVQDEQRDEAIKAAGFEDFPRTNQDSWYQSFKSLWSRASALHRGGFSAGQVVESKGKDGKKERIKLDDMRQSDLRKFLSDSGLTRQGNLGGRPKKTTVRIATAREVLREATEVVKQAKVDGKNARIHLADVDNETILNLILAVASLEKVRHEVSLHVKARAAGQDVTSKSDRVVFLDNEENETEQKTGTDN